MPADLFSSKPGGVRLNGPRIAAIFAFASPPANSGQDGTRIHLILTTAYRARVFDNSDVRQHIAEYISCWAAINDAVVEAVGFGPDHVHLLLLTLHGGFTSELVRSLKSNTSLLARKRHAAAIRPHLWGSRFWSRGYWHRSVPPSAVTATRRYIEHGQAKHWLPKHSTDACNRVTPRVERSETRGSSLPERNDRLARASLLKGNK